MSDQNSNLAAIRNSINQATSVGMGILMLLILALILAWGPKFCAECDGDGKKRTRSIYGEVSIQADKQCSLCGGNGYFWFDKVFYWAPGM